MIRPLRFGEADAAAALWLAANLQARDFIPAAYWQGHFEEVRAQLAEAFVCEADGRILGFLGLDGNDIAGLFVDEAVRGRGVGKRFWDEMGENSRFGALLRAALRLRAAG